jgi:PBP1b-binding outer membrane lipoprotein LpoB
MTKFVKIASVLTLVVALAACSSGRAQDESVVNGDATFSHAQNK